MKRSKGDVLFETINYIFVTMFFISVLYPLFFICIASISNPQLVATGRVLLIPKGLNFDAYRRVLEYKDVWIGYRNTILYAISGTVIGLFITLTAAYPLTRDDFDGKKLITLMLAFTMFFSGGLIPTYLIIKGLGMRNTVWAQIIPGATGFWYIVIVRTFYQKSIPKEIQESAFIDGCSNIKLFINIILPLSKPVIAVMALFFAVNQWNSFFNALIYISKRNLLPLQIFLREILIIDKIDIELLVDAGEMQSIMERVSRAQLLKYVLIIVSTLPIIMVYPFLQKYFIKGMMVGSIKG